MAERNYCRTVGGLGFSHAIFLSPMLFQLHAAPGCGLLGQFKRWVGSAQGPAAHPIPAASSRRRFNGSVF